MFLLVEYWLFNKSFTSIHFLLTNFNAVELFNNLDILWCTFLKQFCLNSFNISCLFSGGIIFPSAFLEFSLVQVLAAQFFQYILFFINSPVASAVLWTTFWKQFLHHLVQFLQQYRIIFFRICWKDLSRVPKTHIL